MIYAFWDLKNYLEKPLLLPSSWSCKNWGPFCLNVVSLCCEQRAWVVTKQKTGRWGAAHKYADNQRDFLCVPDQNKGRWGVNLLSSTGHTFSPTSHAAGYQELLDTGPSSLQASAPVFLLLQQLLWTNKTRKFEPKTTDSNPTLVLNTCRQMKKLSKYKYSHILPFILSCKNKKANKQKGCLSVCTPAYIHVTLVQSLSEVLHYEFPGKQKDHTWSCVHQHLYPLTTYHMDTLLNLLSREKKGSNPH